MISHGDEIDALKRATTTCTARIPSCRGWTGLCARRTPTCWRSPAKAVQLRKNHPVFRRRRFFEGEPIRSGDQVRDIAWLTPVGVEMTHADWGSGFQCVAVFSTVKPSPHPMNAVSAWWTTRPAVLQRAQQARRLRDARRGVRRRVDR